jgi:hypothetical protein
MKFLKAAGISWSIVYFLVGAIKSLSFNSRDTWVTVVLFCTLFLLPLPIAIAAVWFPRASGKALLLCVVTSFAALVWLPSQPNLTFVDICIGLVRFMAYNIPHVVFGLVYVNAGRTQPEEPAPPGPGPDSFKVTAPAPSAPTIGAPRA